MSTTLSLTTQIVGQSSYQNTDALGTVTPQNVNTQNAYKMTYGASASDANDTTTVPTKYHESRHTVTISSGTLDIDLTQLTDVFGTVLNFAHIYAILIHNNDVSGGSGLKVGGAGTNAWSGPFDGSTTAKDTVHSGGDWWRTSPYIGFNVNSGSKILRITNDASSPSGNVSFDLLIWGG